MARYFGRVRTRLACGHVIVLNLWPVSRSSSYMCKMGTGCGYRLKWVEAWYVDTPDRIWTN